MSPLCWGTAHLKTMDSVGTWYNKERVNAQGALASKIPSYSPTRGLLAGFMLLAQAVECLWKGISISVLCTSLK